MPDFSLVFFGAVILSLLVYVTRSIIKSQNKKETICNILLSIVICLAIMYVVSSDNIITTFLFLSSILVILLFTLAFLSFLVDSYLVRMCITNALKKIHVPKKLNANDIFKIKQSFLYSNKTWHIVYSTVNGHTLIGINISRDTPCINKKFRMKTLCGEDFYIDSLNPFNEEDAGKVSIISPLKEFYDSGKENRKIVYNYLINLKNKKF